MSINYGEQLGDRKFIKEKNLATDTSFIKKKKKLATDIHRSLYVTWGGLVERYKNRLGIIL